MHFWLFSTYWRLLNISWNIRNFVKIRVFLHDVVFPLNIFLFNYFIKFWYDIQVFIEWSHLNYLGRWSSWWEHKFNPEGFKRRYLFHEISHLSAYIDKKRILNSDSDNEHIIQNARVSWNSMLSFYMPKLLGLYFDVLIFENLLWKLLYVKCFYQFPINIQ